MKENNGVDESRDSATRGREKETPYIDHLGLGRKLV
jgi:hypothetical protein